MEQKVLTSGIRPTGELHLGNYYGAMINLVKLQEQFASSYYFIVDIHSLTTHPNPVDLRRNVIEVAKDYLAGGLDPARSALYAQSSIAAEICELHTYLSMVMPLGELMRCPTFKEKAKKHPDNVNYGLVGYPVLMAADILIHKGDVVPVGDDQLVHLEMARTMVRRFNQLYGDVFREPQPLMENAVRIPSLSGQGKMSKSDTPETYISMNDDAALIQQKMRRAYSDPARIYRHEPGHPTIEGCNVFHLHHYFTAAEDREEIATQCQQAVIGCVDCKKRLAEAINATIEPFRERRGRLLDEDVIEVLRAGAVQARQSAERVIAEVRQSIGLRMF